MQFAKDLPASAGLPQYDGRPEPSNRDPCNSAGPDHRTEQGTLRNSNYQVFIRLPLRIQSRNHREQLRRARTSSTGGTLFQGYFETRRAGGRRRRYSAIDQTRIISNDSKSSIDRLPTLTTVVGDFQVFWFDPHQRAGKKVLICVPTSKKVRCIGFLGLSQNRARL